MKKSIFKKLVSVVSVLAMIISCTATVFATNEYVSVDSPCDNSKTGWSMTRTSSSVDRHSATAKKVTFLTPGEVINGTPGEIPADGPFGMSRQIFKINKRDAELYGLDASKAEDNGDLWYHANGNAWEAIEMPDNTYGADGNYFFQFTTGGASASYANAGVANAKKFNTGVIQAKFDFAFGGDASQCISVGFTDKKVDATAGANFLGARIYRDNIRFWWPNKDGASDPIYFDEDHTKLGCGTSDYTDAPWYTAVLSYDMDRDVIALSIKSRGNDSFSFADEFSVKDTADKTYIGTYLASGVNTVAFASFRGIDQSVVSTTPNPAFSKWYIDNVSLDAYTETNYELTNTYTSGDGIKSNVQSTGFTLDGITLSRLTNVLDPANASLITASYDGTGRMIAAQSKSLSQIGEDAEDITVSGDTIKSFILDTNTARPYINVFTGGIPATTERSIDFEDDFKLNTFKSTTPYAGGNGAGGLTGLHACNTNKSATMSLVTEGNNTVLKSERKEFRSANGWYYNDGVYTPVASETEKNAIEHSAYFIRLGKTVTPSEGSLKGSIKFKFAGSDIPSAWQEIDLNVGTGDGVATERLIRIRRKVDGSGQVRTAANEIPFTWDENKYMRENEWYTLDFEIQSSKVYLTIKGIFGKTTPTYGTLSGNHNHGGPASFDYFSILSHRDNDFNVSTVPTEGTTQSSVWYIDDIKLEY